MRTVGVLALQGGYAAHAQHLATLGIPSRLVKTNQDLLGIDGLILPGGESTTQLRLIERYGLWKPLCGLVETGIPVLGTCAGLILAASRVLDPEQPCFGWLGVSVKRNGWGRQVHSFQADIAGSPPLKNPERHVPLTFIRAPRIVALGPQDEALMHYGEDPILVKRGSVFGATFHPELTDDLRIHDLVFGR